MKDLVKAGGAFGPILMQADSVDELETYPADATVARHACGGTTESYVQAFRDLVDTLETTTRTDGAPAFVGVGYGSDFNGLAGWPHGRFAIGQDVEGETDFPGLIARWFVGPTRTGPSGRCYSTLGGSPRTPGHVTYPFTSPR